MKYHTVINKILCVYMKEFLLVKQSKLTRMGVIQSHYKNYIYIQRKISGLDLKTANTTVTCSRPSLSAGGRQLDSFVMCAALKTPVDNASFSFYSPPPSPSGTLTVTSGHAQYQSVPVYEMKFPDLCVYWVAREDLSIGCWSLKMKVRLFSGIASCGVTYSLKITMDFIFNQMLGIPYQKFWNYIWFRVLLKIDLCHNSFLLWFLLALKVNMYWDHIISLLNSVFQTSHYGIF